MKSKTWLVSFALTFVLIMGLLAALNALVDPFGAFGDPLYGWYSYGFTKNPRMSKIAFLDMYAGNYDSYLIGASTTGSYPIDQLERYTGARFFNLFGYGGDMHKTRYMAEYLLSHFTVRNLIINISIIDAEYSNLTLDRLTNQLPARVDGSSAFSQTTQYLTANPRYALDKMAAYPTDTWLPQPFDEFDPMTGAYNRTSRDVVPIGDMGSYLEAFPTFKDYSPEGRTLWHIEKCVQDVAAILDLCREQQVNATVIFAPFYDPYLRMFSPGALSRFRKSLAEITEFWDFSNSSASLDPRYFYDRGHFRSPLGAMALARIFGDTSMYIPQDYGFHVTAQNVDGHNDALVKSPADIPHEKELPILTWGQLHEGDLPGFEAQIAALKNAGYQSVTFDQAIDYVTSGKELPHRPVVLTFDGGTLDGDSPAWGVLEEYGMTAGSYAQGLGAGDIIRGGSEEASINAFDTAFGEAVAEWDSKTGGDAPLTVYSYPLEEVSVLTDALLVKSGVRMTLCDQVGNNTLIKGLPQSMIQLRRFFVDAALSPDGLMDLL